VWLTTNADGDALWLYDRETDKVVARKLTVTRPFDDAEAAAVALSIKTLLMHTEAPPPKERFGARATLTPEAPPTVPPLRATSWLLQSAIGVRQSFGDTSTESRLSLAILHTGTHVAWGLRLATGPGRTVDERGFRGQLVDWSGAAEAQWRRPWNGLDWVAIGSVGLHLANLNGRINPGQDKVDETRFNPSLGIGAGIERPLGLAQVGIITRYSYMTRQQRYLVRAVPVAVLPTSNLALELYIGVPL